MTERIPRQVVDEIGSGLLQSSLLPPALRTPVSAPTCSTPPRSLTAAVPLTLLSLLPPPPPVRGECPPPPLSDLQCRHRSIRGDMFGEKRVIAAEEHIRRRRRRGTITVTRYGGDPVGRCNHCQLRRRADRTRRRRSNARAPSSYFLGVGPALARQTDRLMDEFGAPRKDGDEVARSLQRQNAFSRNLAEELLTPPAVEDRGGQAECAHYPRFSANSYCMRRRQRRRRLVGHHARRARSRLMQ